LVFPNAVGRPLRRTLFFGLGCGVLLW
jgi:hypothetical protein